HTRMSQVDVTRRAITCRHPKHLENLPARRIGRVLNSKANSNSTLFQSLLEALLHFFDLGVGRSAVCSIAAGNKLQRLLHRSHTRGNVSSADAVIDQRLPF